MMTSYRLYSVSAMKGSKPNGSTAEHLADNFEAVTIVTI